MNCPSCERRDFASSLRCQWCGVPLQPGARALNVQLPPRPAALISGAKRLGSPASLPSPENLEKEEKSGKSGWKNLLGTVVGALVLVGGKLKLLLGALKFGKLAGTFASMLVSIGFYAALFGWKFAVGFVMSIFVHELGHVVALKRRGIPIEGMYFIPFLGAAVSFKKRPASPAVDAEISWAGPFAGLLCGVFCGAMFLISGNVFWAALAHVTFLLNLINLAPSVPLDGGWIVKAINPKLSLFGSIIGAAIGLYLHSTLLVIICALGAFNGYNAWRGEDDDFEKPLISAATRLKITAAYLGLMLVLGGALSYSTQVLHQDRERRKDDSESGSALSARWLKTEANAR